MGRLVAAAVAAAPDLELAGRYDPKGTDGTIADRSGLAGEEVVVEFCPPDAVMDNLEAWQGLGLHAVVGTSGFTEDRLAAVRKLFGGGPPNCLIVPNFSVGAVLAMRFAEQAIPHFDAAEIIELHHDHKADAPSGTAIAARVSPPPRRRASYMGPKRLSTPSSSSCSSRPITSCSSRPRPVATSAYGRSLIGKPPWSPLIRRRSISSITRPLPGPGPGHSGHLAA